ncbi:APC family permease [Peribacillus sp. SCS-37]|uniref:APC family permease n=1 Tax=Paraperibacillus esterisolvens TaxID=3115296 RepID=UPI003906826C
MAQTELNSGTVHPGIDSGVRQELNRVLTFKDLLVYGMVFMVPIAPMGVYGLVSNESFGMVPLVYLVGIIAMVFTAFGYSQMSREFPVAGSVYSYVQRGLNPHIGFLAGWMILVDYILAPALLYAFGGIWIHSMAPSIPVFVWVLVFVLFNTIVNGRGVALAAKTNFILLGIELIALLIFIGFAIKFVFIDGMGTGGFSLKPLYQSEHISLGFISTAASIAVLSFLGFDGISTLSEETKNPKKTVGKATVAALVILGLIFMVETYMAALIHPEYQGLDPDMGFFDIAREAGGNFLYYLLILVNVVAVAIANALAAQSAISRILYSMSRDKLLPASGFLGKIHPKYKTPLNATVFVGVISLVVALSLSIETIIKFVNFGALTSFLLLNFTVFIYFFIKKKQRNVQGFIKYLLFPLLGFLIIGYVWSGFDKKTFIVGFSWLAVGIIVGAVKSKGFKEVPDSLKNLG